MKRVRALAAFVLAFGLIYPMGQAKTVEAAGTQEESYAPVADVMQISNAVGDNINGLYSDDGNYYLYVGNTNQSVIKATNRSEMMFDIGNHEGIIQKAELNFRIWSLQENTSGHDAFINIWGVAQDTLTEAATVFPPAGSSTVKKHDPATDSGLQTVDVTNIVKEFTSASDRKITFLLAGNEADPQSGRYFIDAKGSNNSGAVATSLKITYYINTDPTGSFSINEGNYTNSTTVNLTVSGSDIDPGDSVAQMRFTENTSSWPAWEPYSTSKAFTLSSGDGLKTVYMQLQDTYGGITQGNITDTITLDTAAPTGTISVNAGAATTNNLNATLTLTSADAGGSGVTEMRFSNDNSTWSGWQAVGSSKAWTLSTGDGAKTVYVQFKDAAGNIATFSDGITLDTTPPIVIGVVHGATYNTHVAATILDGTATSKLDGQTYNSGESISVDGTHTLVATDPSGNATTVTFTIDKTEPTGSLQINSGATFTNSTSATLNIASSDAVSGVSQMQFSNDNSSWSTWEAAAPSKSWSLDTGDGTKTVYARIKDNAGNISTAAISDDIILDTNPPTGSILINGGDAATHSGTVTLSLTNEDGSGSGVSQMRFSNDSSTWSAWEPVALTKSWNLSSLDGTKTVYVQFQDAAGNGSSPINDTIKLDTIAPVVSGVTNGQVTNGNLTITFNGEGTATMDGSPYTEGSVYGEEGSHTLIVTDDAGNVTTVTFTIDKIKPTGTIAINGGAAFTSGSAVTLAITSEDGTGSGVSEMRFSNDNSSWSGWEAVGATKAYTLTTGDGSKTVYAQFKDLAGNVSSGTISDSIDLDQTDPTGSVTINDGDAITNDGAVTLTLTSDDGSGSGVTEMRFSNDNSTWSSWEAVNASKAWTLSTGEGVKTVYAQFKDSAGNESVSTSDTIALDTIGPIVSGVTDGQISNADLNISFNEGTAKIDGVDFTSGSTYGAEGAHTLIVTDAVGNVTTVTFTVDKTKPTGTIAINGGAAFTNDSAVTLTLTSDDGTGSGVKEMSFSSDNSTWSSWEAVGASKAYTLPTGDGTKTVYVHFKDKAGNISSVAISATIDLDQTDPSGTVTINDGDALTNDGTVTLALTSGDGSGSGVSKMRFSNDNSTWSSWEAVTASKAWALATGDGVKTVYVQFRDTAGNESASITDTIELDATDPIVTGVTDGQIANADLNIAFNEGTAKIDGVGYTSGTGYGQEGGHTLIVKDDAGNETTVTFTIDKTKPTGTISINSGAAFTNNDEVTLALTSADGTGTGVTEMRFSNDNSTWSSWEAVGASKAYTLPTGDGTKTVYVQFKDLAGNISSDTISDSIHLDQASPTGTVTINAGDAYTNDASVTLTMTSDDGSGAGNIEMRISNDDSAWSPWEPVATSKTWGLAAGDGTKTVYVQLRDAVGNLTAISDSILLDGTSPDVTGVTDGFITNSNVTIHFTEGSATVNGSPFTEGTTVSAEGSHTLVVTDDTGNATTIHFQIDKTIPTGTMNINNDAPTTNSRNVTLYLTYGDGASGSGVTHVRVSNNGTDWSAWQAVASTITWTVTDSAGRKDVYVQFKDAAGNISVTAQDFISVNNGNGGGPPPKPKEIAVVVDGVEQVVPGDVTVKETGGKKTAVVTVDSDALIKKIETDSSAGATIVVPVTQTTDVVVSQLNGQLLQAMDTKNAKLELRSENASYTLPANQIDMKSLSDHFGSGVAAKDIAIEIQIGNVQPSNVQFASIGAGNVVLVAPAIEFTVTASYGGQKVEVNQFDTYVERRIAIPDGVDPSRITTGVVLTPDGRILPVPTKVVHEGGKYYAVINSLTNSTYSVIFNSKSFADTAKHWAKASIENMASRLILSGVDQEHFKPDNKITRAEFTAIIVRALGLRQANKSTSFNDVKSSDWFNNDVAIGVSYGIVGGYSDGSFKPGKQITREEAMIVIARAMEIVGLNTKLKAQETDELLQAFADRDQFSGWAREAAALNARYGIITGTNGMAKPKQLITRAETAIVIEKLLQKAGLI